MFKLAALQGRTLLVFLKVPKHICPAFLLAHSVKPSFFSKAGSLHQRARRLRRTKVEGIQQSIIASLQVLSSGELDRIYSLIAWL